MIHDSLFTVLLGTPQMQINMDIKEITNVFFEFIASV